MTGPGRSPATSRGTAVAFVLILAAGVSTLTATLTAVIGSGGIGTIVAAAATAFFATTTSSLAVFTWLDERAVFTWLDERQDKVRRFRTKLKVLGASSLTDLAVLLAGRRRLSLRDEWRAHLAGEGGHDPVTSRQIRQALGFVAAAIQLRLADAADLAWRPADAVLGSRFLSNLFVGGPVIVTLFAIVHHDGRFGLVTDIQDVGELGAFLYGVIRAGRWWRQIKLAEPKPRRAKE